MNEVEKRTANFPTDKPAMPFARLFEPVLCRVVLAPHGHKFWSCKILRHTVLAQHSTPPVTAAAATTTTSSTAAATTTTTVFTRCIKRVNRSLRRLVDRHVFCVNTSSTVSLLYHQEAQQQPISQEQEEQEQQQPQQEQQLFTRCIERVNRSLRCLFDRYVFCVNTPSTVSLLYHQEQ